MTPVQRRKSRHATVVWHHGERLVLCLSTIEELKARGMNQSQIAELFGVSRQAVSWHIREYDGLLSDRTVLLEGHFPWTVPVPQSHQSPYRIMRDHAQWWLANGAEGCLPPVQYGRVRAWHSKLRDGNLVVEYDPAIPPDPGFAKYGGFALRRRAAADGDLMFRVNEHCTVTELAREVWALPRGES